jgi:DNA modification methylase
VTATIDHGDCLEVLRGMANDSVDSVVTDPPYGLSFMGKKWDYDVPSEDIWRECLRVLKPGGHLLAFAGTRTQHRMAVNIQDAGFEIRDMIAWVYGSGFPKSLNVATAIGKLAEPKAEPKAEEVEFCQWLRDNSTVEAVTATLGRRFWDCKIQIVNAATKERPVMARRALVPTAAKWQGFKAQHQDAIPPRIEELAKPEPQRAETPGDEWTPGKGSGTAGEGDWQGWGTALKPALEPITVARKPLGEKTVAANVLTHGTGALNVDGCRVASNGDKLGGGRVSTDTEGWDRPWKHNPDAIEACKERGEAAQAKAESLGRWPANLIHDGSDEVVGLFPQSSGGHWSYKQAKDGGIYQHGLKDMEDAGTDNTTGSAARFFYCAKASKADRDEGCEGLEVRDNLKWASGDVGIGAFYPDGTPRPQKDTKQRNFHPTVKPTALMRYLCRLVTPPGGIVLDPFMGSGSTGKAATLEGFQFIGIEREAEYVAIAKARIVKAEARRGEMLPFQEVAA